LVWFVSNIFLKLTVKKVIAANKEVTATLNSEVELKWTISTDIKITNIGVFIGTKVPANQIISGARALVVTTIGRTRFGDRISAELRNNEVVVKIRKVQLKETNSVFIINVLEYISAADNTEFLSEIKLIVQGGPIFCADQIPATRTYKENTTPSILVTVCGIPKPTVTWKLDFISRPVGVTMNSTSQSHGYDYSVTLSSLRPSMCGKHLLLQADGYSGKITATSTLDMDFTPAFITSVQFYKADACNQVTWLPLDTGNCNVTYTVQYTNSSGSIIATVNNLVQASHCEYNFGEGSSVKVWATYKGIQGPAGPGTALLITTTIITTTTTPIMATKSSTTTITTSTTTTNTQKSLVWIVVILAVALVLFVVAFFVTFWFNYRMKAELVRIKKSQSPLYSDLNYVKTSNYADLLKEDQSYVNPNTNNTKVQSDSNSRISDTNAMYEDGLNDEVPPPNYEVPPSNYEVAPESIA